MEDSYRIAPCEIQGLQPNKDEQTAWKDRSSPPRTILPSAILHPRCRHGGVVGSGSLFSKSHISYRRTLDSEIVKKISEKKGVGTGQKRGQTTRNPTSITCSR